MAAANAPVVLYSSYIIFFSFAWDSEQRARWRMSGSERQGIEEYLVQEASKF